MEFLELSVVSGVNAVKWINECYRRYFIFLSSLPLCHMWNFANHQLGHPFHSHKNTAFDSIQPWFSIHPFGFSTTSRCLCNNLQCLSIFSLFLTSFLLYQTKVSQSTFLCFFPLFRSSIQPIYSVISMIWVSLILRYKDF